MGRPKKVPEGSQYAGFPALLAAVKKTRVRKAKVIKLKSKTKKVQNRKIPKRVMQNLLSAVKRLRAVTDYIAAHS